jgi:hypothetical protein
MASKQNLLKEPLSMHPNHHRKFYGANLAEVLQTPIYGCSLENMPGLPDLALIRLKGGSMEMQREPYGNGSSTHQGGPGLAAFNLKAPAGGLISLISLISHKVHSFSPGWLWERRARAGK